MTNLLMETEQMVEGRVVHVADRPIPFERFLDMAEGQWLENDRPSDLRTLEADYARLGVPELVFINLRKGELRLLHLHEGAYDQTILTSGPVVFQSMGGLILQAEWILTEPRPDEFDTLTALFAA